MTKTAEGPEPNLAFVGTHGPPEVVGIELSKITDTNPIPGWDVEVANEEVVGTDKRFIDHNLALAFGDADPLSASYERRRAAELLKIAAGRETVIDIHDTVLDAGEYAQIHTETNPKMLGVAAMLGIKQIVVVTHELSILGHNPNSIVIEMGRQDGMDGPSVVERNVARVRDCLGTIAVDGLPDVSPEAFEYSTRLFEVKKDRAEELGLPDLGRIAPFEALPLNSGILPRLRLPPDDYITEYWNGECSADDHFGSVLLRVPPLPMGLDRLQAVPYLKAVAAR